MAFLRLLHPPTAVHSSLITLLLLPLLPPAMTLPELPFHRAADGGPVVPVTNLVKFLERLQLAALTSFGKLDFDLKYYVDLSLKHDLNSTERAFDALRRSPNGSVPVEELKTFIREYFGSAGNDMVYLEPADFVPLPKGFLPKVENAEVRAWALDIHRLWKNLSRTASDDLLNRPDDHTLLPLPKPCVIPGSRFRETYYWDSYWIIRYGGYATVSFRVLYSFQFFLLQFLVDFGHLLTFFLRIVLVCRTLLLVSFSKLSFSVEKLLTLCNLFEWNIPL